MVLILDGLSQQVTNILLLAFAPISELPSNILTMSKTNNL